MVLRQSLPSSASDYARTQRAEIGAAVSAVGRVWGRMGEDFDLSYRSIEQSLLAVVLTAQERIAVGAQEYIPAVLAETGQRRAIPAAAQARTTPLIGVAGDGRPVDGLMYESVIGAKVGVGKGMSTRQALVSSGQWLTQAVGTLLSDTGRSSESLAIGLRPIGGYVRMLNAPSCSRCVILAGKRYSAQTAFLRHPGCDCRNIPASESIANDLTVNPQDYIDSLTTAEQDRLLGKAGAEAVREGADLNQVVNARRGMKAAQIGGRDVLLTTEGTTRRGLAYRPGRPRLMPETIRSVATDRADYLRLLRANGYIR